MFRRIEKSEAGMIQVVGTATPEGPCSPTALGQLPIAGVPADPLGHLFGGLVPLRALRKALSVTSHWFVGGKPLGDRALHEDGILAMARRSRFPSLGGLVASTEQGDEADDGKADHDDQDGEEACQDTRESHGGSPGWARRRTLGVPADPGTAGAQQDGMIIHTNRQEFGVIIYTTVSGRLGVVGPPSWRQVPPIRNAVPYRLPETAPCLAAARFSAVAHRLLADLRNKLPKASASGRRYLCNGVAYHLLILYDRFRKEAPVGHTNQAGEVVHAPCVKEALDRALDAYDELVMEFLLPVLPFNPDDGGQEGDEPIYAFGIEVQPALDLPGADAAE